MTIYNKKKSLTICRRPLFCRKPWFLVWLFMLKLFYHECVHLCGEVESTDHVLLRCLKVWRIWSIIINWCGLTWVSPGSVGLLLELWQSWKFKKAKKIVWEVIPVAVLWSVWNLRNKYECVFSDEQPNSDDLVDLIKFRVVFWAKTKSDMKNWNMTDLLFCWEQLSLCLLN
ncbi:unnamed protein product [Camellia sinensis]